MHVQLTHKVFYYVLLSTGIKTALTLKTAKVLQIQLLRYIFTKFLFLEILQGQFGFHFFMDSLKSDKVAILVISQGREFQMTGLILLNFFQKV